ncbi:MAG: IS5 family transposase [Flavobacteriales bacterium]|nr:IS5 family transposase [Flavobacteriales bacterium]NCP85145.1 IS5 family transposase [Bacteroidota bacterium]NCQ13279.1 IS5 family transposase [Flavobacteriales bacterium]PIV92942.1 MAG: IS5/IS1182 family transposase [Flavobacteriaceae bacterium CG17_big_fil_post_rev_8_21_14_2_50_33_15]
MYKTQGKKGLFDEELTKERLSVMGNPLDSVSKVIDFEIFRDSLENKLLNTNKKNNAGAKPYDVVLLFKILILQRYYGLGDNQVEYQILDRTSFKAFLALETGDKVPDEKTVWSFRERITKTGLVEELFEQFISFLEEKELILNQGQMIDASFTVAPRQRNTREENKKIKNGAGEDLWNDKPNKKKHKDIDARWTKKNGETFYGYKNHAKVDTKSKFINKYSVTDASVHDSQVLDDLLEEKDKDQELHADSAYTGEEQDKTIAKYEMKNNVHEKGYRNKPLTQEQKANNTKKSKIRARVEHVFGFMEQSMNGLALKSIGIIRATGIIGLINLTYNLFRYEQIKRLNLTY